MRAFRWICLFLGLGLFGVIIANTDVEDAIGLVLRMEWGIAVVLAIYLAGFLGDSASWQITLRGVPLTLSWFCRLWIVRMIGEAFNNTLPAGGMGGEPVKAVLLNRHFNVAYSDGTASLFLTKTINMIALIGFLAVGFILMVAADRLPVAYTLVTGVGLAVLTAAVLAFFLIQRCGVSSTVITWLSRWSHGRRMIGEAFNNTLPVGGMGGEPVKAVLLNRHFNVAYSDGTASLFLTKTINMIALIGFLAVGFILMVAADRLPVAYTLVTGVGLAVLTAAVLAFFLIQRCGVSSTVITWLSRWSHGRRMASAIDPIAEVERRFEFFYARSRSRFSAALGLAFAVWLMGAAEVYFALYFLGRPVSWLEAWIIEAGAQLVRTGTFFIPASLGTLDGALLLLCSVFTGSPTVGFAVVLVRRLREIIWIASGFGLSFVLPITPDSSAAKAQGS